MSSRPSNAAPKVKKKLEIDPLHAETVRLIYRLALHGDGAKGQMGVKNIVSHLNRNRIFTRDGGRWGIGQVHRILTRRTYMGEHEFNKRAKSKELKPVSEIVVVPVPPLIDRETFDAVQALLKARHPTVTPSAVISGPTMLTGLIHCAKCGGAMTIRTGKGGRYRYYACSMKARQGPTACEGMAVPMDKLDDLVASHLEDRLLQPERLETILATVLDRRQERSERQHEHIGELNRRAAESEARLKRLYDAIEAGVADLTTRRSRTASTASRPSAIRRRPMPSAPRPCLRTPAARPLPRRWCAPSPKPRGGISALKAAAIAATIFARSPSALRSQMARSGSWDRSPGCYRC